MIANPSKLSRRQLIHAVGAILATTTLSPGILAAIDQQNPPPKSRLITRYQRRIIHTCCDLILPETSTPGAVAAGVPDFIDHILVNYYSMEHALQFLQGIEQLAQMGTHSDQWMPSTDSERFNWLLQIDREALRDKKQTTLHQAYRDLKGLTLVGYYTSQQGATQELHWDPVPGAYRGDVDYSSVGSASASTRS